MLAALLVLGAAITAGAQAAEATPVAAERTLTLESRLEGARLRLGVVHGEAAIAIERSGRGVVVRSAVPFDPAALAAVGARHGAWIGTLNYGYDSFYLEPAAGIALTFGTAPQRLHIELDASAAADAPGAPDGAEAALRLARLDALARGRAGDPSGARARLRALMEARPDDLQNLIDLLEQERALGRWRPALALYARALARDPDAAWLVAGKAGLLREVGPHVRASFEFSDVEDEDEQYISVLEGRTFLGRRHVARLRFEHRAVSDPVVQSPHGFVERFDGQRVLGSLYVQGAGPGPGAGHLELHSGDGDPGLSLGYRLGLDPGETRLQLDLWRPYWDFVEGVVHGGFRHRAAVRQQLRSAGPWQVEFGVHASRYGADGDARLADTLGATFAASYALRRAEPYVGIEYYFDTEYYGAVRVRRDAAGNLFAPVAFEDREIHQLALVWSEQLTDYIRIGARAGYTVDRYNAHGRNLGAELGYAPLPGLEIGLRFYQSITAARGGSNTLNSFGGFLLLSL